jgi:tight adherence protein B
VAAAAPFLIIFAVGGAVALGFLAFWEHVIRYIGGMIEPYRTGLDRAALPIKTEALAFGVLGGTIVPWGAIMIFLRPSLLYGLVALVVFWCIAFVSVRAYINVKVVRRLNEFNNQLEMGLRLIAGAMRVGLGLRQALTNVIADMPDPARVEFMRVLSQTQIGVSIFDALDQLAERMPSSEMDMMTRAIRLQSQTGGNLSRVLDNLADTIKERRRVVRKMRALTAEARSSKYIIAGLPIFVGTFVMSFEPEMRDGLINTGVGRICLLIVVGLISLGWYIFGQLSKIDV